MPDTGRKIPLRVRMAITIAIATAIAVVFHMADVPLNAPAVLGVTAVTALFVEGFALVYTVMTRPRVTRP